MSAQSIVQQQAQNRRAQRTPIPLEAVLSRINKHDYQKLIQWVFQNSEIMRLSCSTKFLARTFFDASIIDFQIIPYDQYIALAMGALALAIKFNERRELSEQLTLQALLQSANITLATNELFRLQVKIMRSLSFVFRFTTPNDYLNIFIQRFPFFPIFKKVIPKFIELAMMRPHACEYTAEEIFFGAVLALIDLHKPTMNDCQNRILFSLTDIWEEARSVANIIRESFTIVQQQSAAF